MCMRRHVDEGQKTTRVSYLLLTLSRYQRSNLGCQVCGKHLYLLSYLAVSRIKILNANAGKKKSSVLEPAFDCYFANLFLPLQVTINKTFHYLHQQWVHTMNQSSFEKLEYHTLKLSYARFISVQCNEKDSETKKNQSIGKVNFKGSDIVSFRIFKYTKWHAKVKAKYITHYYKCEWIKFSRHKTNILRLG